MRALRAAHLDRGRTYTSRVLGSSEEYWVGSEKLGEARCLGDGIMYHDSQGKIVGEALRLGNSIIFRDVKGNELATRTPLGDKHIYRNAGDQAAPVLPEPKSAPASS